ncbi:MarR family transcriptional regulator [Aeromicrobium sp.]|uniref:MarR family transcriptional regulator n=1 Tax=Aeromicrobium sp. TaxID=1871063 RepID=UPI0030C373C2
MDDSKPELRRLSRDAFGQQYRLEIMLAVAASEDGIVCLSDLAQELSLTPSNVQSALRSMIDTGLLTELPRGDSRRKFLLRNPSAAWEWANELQASATQTTTDMPGSIRDI